MSYIAVIEEGPNSFGAYVPDLPGCVAAARTRAEVVALIGEAIELHLQTMHEEGIAVPAPLSTAELVNVGG